MDGIRLERVDAFSSVCLDGIVGIRTARTHGGQIAAQTVVPTAVGATAAPTEQARGTSGFQRSFADLVTAALPAEALGKPVEIWFTDG